MAKFTMRQAADAYVAHLEAEGKQKTTVGVYRRALDLAVDHFGEDRDVGKMMPAHVAAFYRSKGVTRKPDGSARADISATQIRRVLRQALVHAKEAGLTDNLPLPKEEAAKVPKAAEADD